MRIQVSMTVYLFTSDRPIVRVKVAIRNNKIIKIIIIIIITSQKLIIRAFN